MLLWWSKKPFKWWMLIWCSPKQHVCIITHKLKASILFFTLLDGCFPGSSLYCLWPPQQLEESWFLGQTLHTRRSGTGTHSPTSTKRLDPLNWFCSSSNSHFFIYQPWGEARMLLQSLCKCVTSIMADLSLTWAQRTAMEPTRMAEAWWQGRIRFAGN